MQLKILWNTNSFLKRKAAEPAIKRAQFRFAKDGENCFDIAYANSVKLEDIIELNGFKTPFDVQEGQRVRIR